MTLGIFVVVLMVGIAGTYLGMAFVADRPRGAGSANDTERRMVSVLIVAALVIALAVRPVEFGVDTLTYFRMYDQFCFSNVDDLELSYQTTFSILNLFQFGACNSWYLTTTWIVLIALCFAALPDEVVARVKMAALALFSLIGIELATNALRQGLSAAVMMLAFAWFQRNRPVGIVLAVLAVLLHASTGLVLVALLISMLPFRYFAVAFALLVTLVLSYSYLGLDIEALNRLTGEIDKYSAHDADDLYIRILAATQLFVPWIVAVATKLWVSDKRSEVRADLSIALKVSLTALPYLVLPYFGYRYIYGIYLVVLYLTREALLDDRRPAFELVLIANGLIALVWALGSSYVGQVPFVVF